MQPILSSTFRIDFPAGRQEFIPQNSAEFIVDIGCALVNTTDLSAISEALTLKPFWVYVLAILFLVLSASPQETPPSDTGGRKKGGAPKSPGENNPTKAVKQTAPSPGGVQYLALVSTTEKPKLPYGQGFTIKGKVSQICIKGTYDESNTAQPCGPGGQPLKDLITPTSVGGFYVVNGAETPFTPSDISGDDWLLTVRKLDENTPVSFKFAFQGNLSLPQASAIIDELLSMHDYVNNLELFVSTAQEKREQLNSLATAFGQSTAAQVLDLLKKHNVRPQDTADLGKRLFSPSVAVFRTLVNIPAELHILQGSNLTDADRAKLGIDTKMAPGQVYRKVKQAITQDEVKADRQLTTQVTRFIENYESLQKELAGAVIAELSVSTGTTADDVTQDLQKYAGFDVGALYVPRLHELRSFATLNIYIKPVSLHPIEGTRNQAWERLSFTFGLSWHDISGGDSGKSKISGENAFIYGIGLRLNKYFRITTGGLAYRTRMPAGSGAAGPLDGKIRHEFYIGPSIDITAIPALKGVFAKAQSK